ncbi:hypothetical protein [Nitratireductor sp. GCM10026969]|uniref:hypothetical protein n=1 Tax=Nitratireductor sp. GCM10026969 TaxID=3252645 RepID=UPI0036156A17
MFVHLLRLLGVTPNDGKTGKREAAWALIAIALGLTLGAMWAGFEMVQAMTAVLVIIWPSAILAVAGAYKLEHDKEAWRQAQPPRSYRPSHWPQDVAAPHGDEFDGRVG